MANYQNTLLLNVLADLTENANKDLRAPIYGATNAFSKYKRNVIMNYDAFANANHSEKLTKQIDYIKRSSESVGSSRAASLTGAFGDSVRDTLTFVTYSREWTISDDVMRNNTQQAGKILAAQIANARIDIGAAVETAAVVKLEAFKDTTSKATSKLGTWDGNYSALGIANADEDLYWNYLSTDMRLLNHNGPYQSIHNELANALIGRQMAQGAGNSANLTYQFPNWEFETSNSITNASDYFTTGYVVPAGTIALVDWIPEKNREGLVNHGTFDFTAMPDPFGKFDRLALAIEKKVQSGAGYTQTTQDAVWLYEMSVDVAFYIPTLTTGKLVQKYGLKSS